MRHGTLGAFMVLGLVTCGAPERPALDPARLAVALAAHRPKGAPPPPPVTGRLHSLTEELFTWILGEPAASPPVMYSYYLSSTLSWSGITASAPPAPEPEPVLHLPSDSVDEEGAWSADPWSASPAAQGAP